MNPLIEPVKRTLRRWPLARRIKLEIELRQGKSLVPQAAMQERYEAALRWLRAHGDSPVGDYLEFGVYNGSSLLCMHRAALACGLLDTMRLVGFDSFEGLPADAAALDGGVWQPGWYHSTEGFTRARLTREGIDWSRTTLVKGWFRDTLRPEVARQLDLRHAGVVLIDCDLYASTVEALRFCEPLMGLHTVIFFDDWGSFDLAERGMGERQAFDEFLAAHPHFVSHDFDAYGAPSRAFILERRDGAA